MPLPQPVNAPSASAPGQMTTLMRTVAVATGPRVPRIAVVRGGRILEEHLLRNGEAVTIGAGEGARVVVPGAADLPAAFELLERAGSRYWLRFTSAMSGRVAGLDGIASLEELRTRAHEAGGAYRVALAEDARGKVVVGDTTLLFQLVPPPPVLPRPRLPIGVMSGMGLDWRLTILVAFSFLLHFGVAGAVYSDWMDPVVATDRVASGIVDDLSRLPKVSPEAVPQDQGPRVADNEKVVAPTPSPAPAASPRSRDARPTRSSAPTHAPPIEDALAATLAAKADRLELDLLAARAGGPSVQKALDRTSVPTVDLSAAAARNVGVTHEPSNGLKVATGGPVQAGHSSLPGLAGPTQRTARENAGPETTTAGPTLRVDTPRIGSPGSVTDADRVVASLRSRFRKCYQDGLAVNPTMSGKAVIVARVGPNGEVLSTEVGSNDGLSSAVTSCIARVIQNAQFSSSGGVATLRVPVSLVQQ